MQFSAFAAAVLAVALPATHALVGYKGLHCEGEPNLYAPCNGRCHSFANSSSFRVYTVERPAALCVRMWTGPDCTGTPYEYTEQAQQCTSVTFPAASFSCGDIECFA